MKAVDGYKVLGTKSIFASIIVLCIASLASLFILNINRIAYAATYTLDDDGIQSISLSATQTTAIATMTYVNPTRNDGAWVSLPNLNTYDRAILGTDYKFDRNNSGVRPQMYRWYSSAIKTNYIGDSGTNAQFTVAEGLSPGTQYTFYFGRGGGDLGSYYACYSLGLSDWFYVISEFPVQTLPSVPTISVTSASDTSVTINYVGSGPATSYSIYVNGSLYTSVASGGSAGTKSCTISGLSLGQGYTIKVAASTSSGTVTDSKYIVTSFPLSVSSNNTNSANITTSNPTSFGCSYQIDRSTASNFSSGVQNIANWNGSTSYTDSGLTAGTTYYYRLRATYSNGAISAYSYANCTTKPVTPTVTIASKTDTSFTINYVGSGPTATHQIYVNNNLYGTVGSGQSAGTKSYTISGLMPGAYYDIKVVASNSSGSASSETNGTTNTVSYTISQTSGSLGWSEEGRGYIRLSWPSIPNVTSYEIDVWDGYTYRAFNTGTTTYWDSREWLIYPSEASLNSYSNNTVTNNLFNTVKGGLNLRDDPSKLYLKTSDSTWDTATRYNFRLGVTGNYSGWTIAGYIEVTLPDSTDVDAPALSSVATNTGLSKTVSKDLKVVIYASDSESGITRVQLSNSSDFTSYQEYTYIENGEYSYSIPDGAGTKTVYARVFDAVGNMSVTKSFSVYLVSDMTPPVVSIAINNGDDSTSDPSIQITLNVYDDYTNVSEMKMRYSWDGSSWTAWEALKLNFWLMMSPSNPPAVAETKRVFVQVQDLSENVGNSSDSIIYVADTKESLVKSTSKKDTIPPSISIETADGRTATQSGANVPIAVKATDNITPMEQLRISTDQGSTWKSYERIVNIKVTGSGMQSIYVLVKDLNDNTADDFVQLYVY